MPSRESFCEGALGSPGSSGSDKSAGLVIIIIIIIIIDIIITITITITNT